MDAVAERAWTQALLDVEAALTSALAGMGQVPRESAARIARACDADAFDLDALATNSTPVAGLVMALRDHLPEADRAYVHAGATSQDIADTALMLVAQRALTPLLATVQAAAWTVFELAQAHRHTPMPSQALLHQELPITFGLRAAIWLDGIDSARARLRVVHETGLAVQMSGPVGARDPELGHRVAIELGLADPVIGWGATRVRTAELAGALGVLAAVLGTVARDVTLLAADDVREVSEGGRATDAGAGPAATGEDPCAAATTLACTRRVPALVAAVLAGVESGHERDAGAGLSEWRTVAELLTLTGAAASASEELVAGLHVDADRMAEHLRAAGGDQAPAAAIDQLIDRALAAHLSPAVEPGGFSTERPGSERVRAADTRRGRRDRIR